MIQLFIIVDQKKYYPTHVIQQAKTTTKQQSILIRSLSQAVGSFDTAIIIRWLIEIFIYIMLINFFVY